MQAKLDTRKVFPNQSSCSTSSWTRSAAIWGLPAFPPKDLQWRFLSRATPFISYVPDNILCHCQNPPFVVNYQGAIFRQYPGPSSACSTRGAHDILVSTSARRPALGEFKETITMALKIGAKSPPTKGRTASFRTGVKRDRVVGGGQGRRQRAHGVAGVRF